MEISDVDMFGEETQPKTLYVGNLNSQMTEDFLHVLFSQIGAIKGCKIIQEILLFWGIITLNIVSGVFWNGKHQLLRMKTRPPRHYSPTSYHHTNNRVYKPIVRQYRQPNYFSSSKPSYHQVNQGPLIVNGAAHYPYHSPPPKTMTRHPIPPSHNYPMQHFPPRTRPPEFPKFHSPISNFVQSPGLNAESDTNQHGYLAPTYSGWKPISKPYFGFKGPLSDTYSYAPTTEVYTYATTRKQNVNNMNTLFKDNVKQIKSFHDVKLKPEYSENQGVSVPRPIHHGDTYRIPPTFFEQPPSHIPFHPFKITGSQSEEKPVVAQKAFPKFQNRPKPGVLKDSNSETEMSTQSPQLLSKFKISRPKLKVQSHTSFPNNEPEIEGIEQGVQQPKITLSSTNNGNSAYQSQSQQSPPLNLNPKVHKLRSRVKVKERKPEGFVNTEKLSHVLSYRPHGQTPGSQKETKENSNSRQPPLTLTQHHPSPTYLGNETYDVIPLFRPPSFSTEFPVPPFPSSSDFMNGFGSDEQRHVTRDLGHKIPGGQNIGEGTGGGSKQNVVERPFQTPEDSQRGIRRKRPKIQYNHLPTTTTTTVTPVPSFNNNKNESPVHPEEFYIPPGFTQSPSLGGQNPVSFMTMPNAQPQVIHHIPYQHHHSASQQPQHNIHPINFHQSSKPYNNYNSEQHQQIHGSNPNIYQPNNKPFLFMNIQNGRNHGGQEVYSGDQKNFEGNTSPPPFYNQPSHIHHGQGFQNQHRGTLELNPPFHQFPPPRERGNDPRNSYIFPIPSPPLENYNNYNQHQPHFAVQDPNVNLEAYASNEYERIPMEFMNDLRPILEESVSIRSPIPTLYRVSPEKVFKPSHRANSFDSSITTPFGQSSFVGTPQHTYETSQQNSFHPSRPEKKVPFQFSSPSSESPNSEGSGFIKDFFDSDIHRPYLHTTENTGSSESTKLYLIPHQSEESMEKNRGEEYDNYKSSASNFQPQVLKHKLHSTTPPSFHNKSPPHRPSFITISPLQDFSLVTTVSPIYDFDFSRGILPVPPKWSKLKTGGVVGIFSTEGYKALGNKYKSLVKKENDTKAGLGQEIKRSSSTPHSLLPSPGEVPTPPGSYSHPTPLVLKNMSLDGSEDDSSDSNTPKSAKARGNSGNRIQENSTPRPSSATTTTKPNQSNRRQFRRRRPGMLARRKFMNRNKGDKEDGTGTTTSYPPTFTPSSTTSPQMKEETDFESFKISLKSQRVRGEKSSASVSSRMGLRDEKKMTTTTTTTTESSVNPDPVTYGETQWFKIKESPVENSEELGYYNHGTSQEEKVSDDVVFSVPEKKKEGEKFSFSSRILSTTPHVKLEPLGLGLSSEGVQESRNLSTKIFYPTGK